MNIKNIFSGLFKPTLESSHEGKLNKAALMIDEVILKFEESIAKRSWPGRLMFDTAYAIYAPRAYFKNLNLVFGIATQDIVEKFHEILNRRLKNDNKLKYSPIFDRWTFDLIPLSEGSVDMRDEDNPDSRITFEDLEEQTVAVWSELVPQSLYTFAQVSDDDELETNRSKPHSKNESVKKLCIGAIKGLQPNGSYSYPIQIRESSSNNLLNDGNTSGSRISLKSVDGEFDFIHSDGKKYQAIEISYSDFFIGGASASYSYQGSPMLCISKEDILSPHIEIKRTSEGWYMLKAFGPTKVNGIPVAKNEWVRISDRNSSILLNDEIEIAFNKK